MRVFRYWPFTNSLLLIAVLSVGLFTVLFYIPLFLQQAQGMGAFETGLLLLPQALVMAVLMPVAGGCTTGSGRAGRRRSACSSSPSAPTCCTTTTRQLATST